MVIQLIILGIVLLNVLCLAVMLYKFYRQPATPLSFLDYVKLTFSGIVAFIADTFGLGSFAVNIALAKLLGTFNDDELPAVSNGAQVVPGVIESLFFLKQVEVDITTLLVLVIGASIGGMLGGGIVSQLSKQAIRLAMVCCFALLIILLLAHQLHWLPQDGELVELHTWRLAFGFLGMVFCGALTSVGVGLFVMVQGVLFLLNVSPLIAFPIMTTAGAMQQPLTALVFLQQDKIPLKKTLILSFAGCIGVGIALPLFKQLTSTWLHILLLFILMYNFLVIGRAYLNARARYSPTHPPLTLQVNE